MKTLTKKTYSLPVDVVTEFERHTAPGKRGVAVAEALRHWMEAKKREELRTRILEGLADEENEALYREVEREWSPLSDEVWARLPDEEWPEPAIVWPNGLKAEREKHGDTPDGH